MPPDSMRIRETSRRQRLVLTFWGVYKLMVGILAAAESVVGIARSANPPGLNGWGLLTIAASVLLAIDGLKEILPNVNRRFYLAIAAVTPMAIYNLSGTRSGRLWMFAIALGFIEWVSQKLEETSGQAEMESLACCITLACSLANTTFMIFLQYWDEPQFWPLSQIFRFMLPIALPWTLVLILLVHSARALMVSSYKREQGSRLASKAADK